MFTLLRENELLPVILTVPTGSIKEFTKYVTRLLQKRRKTNQVVTRFSLKKAQNSTGIAFSQIVCSVDRQLTPDEQRNINSMSDQVKAYAGTCCHYRSGVNRPIEEGGTPRTPPPFIQEETCRITKQSDASQRLTHI